MNDTDRSAEPTTGRRWLCPTALLLLALLALKFGASRLLFGDL